MPPVNRWRRLTRTERIMMTFKPGDKVTPEKGLGIKYNGMSTFLPGTSEKNVLVVLESIETEFGEKITFADRPGRLVFFYPAKHFRLYEEAPVQDVKPCITEEPLKTFYLVWNKAGGAPNRSHVTRQSADKEAKRLAATNPGKKFFVLEVVGAAHVQIAKDVSYDLYAPKQENAEPAPKKSEGRYTYAVEDNVPKKSEGHYSFEIVDTGVCTGAFDFDGGIFDILIKNPEGVGLVHVEGRGATAFLEDLKEIEKLVGTEEANGTLEEMRDVYLSQYDFDKKSREFNK